MAPDPAATGSPLSRRQRALENLAGALTTPATADGPSKREKAQAHELAQLKARLAKKDEVIAEISAKYVNLKKELGGAPEKLAWCDE